MKICQAQNLIIFVNCYYVRCIKFLVHRRYTIGFLYDVAFHLKIGVVLTVCLQHILNKIYIKILVCTHVESYTMKAYKFCTNEGYVEILMDKIYVK